MQALLLNDTIVNKNYDDTLSKIRRLATVIKPIVFSPRSESIG